MADDSTKSLYFPSMAAGVLSTAPPRALQDPAGQYLYRDALNVLTREGVLVGRPGFAAYAGLGTPPSPPTITGVDTTEYARYIALLNQQGGLRAVLITNRQAWVYSGSWVNVTPTYAVGTVTATNGSNSITGAGGTLWSDLGVGGYVVIDGGTYKFVATGNAAATITPAFAGATGAGKAYVVTRVFGAQFVGTDANLDRRIFATIYNLDLYIAGDTLGGPGGAAVVKVSSPFGTPSTAYLTAQTDLTGSLDLPSANMQDISGLDVMEDGRVLVTALNQVIYSSHLDVTVWSVSPAGSTPLVSTDNYLTALGRIGGTYMFHHAGGVIMGDPTGAADPPLRFQATQATKGCAFPHTLQPYRGGEVFISSDYDPTFFDGNSTRQLGYNDDLRARLVTAVEAGDVTPGFYAGWLYGFVTARDEYGVAVPTAAGTRFWVYQGGLDGGSWWPQQTSLYVGAFTDTAEKVGVARVTALVGGASSGSLVRAYKEGAADVTGTPTYMVETDDLDAGLPVTYKTPMRAAVWPVATMDDLTVSVRRADDSAGYVAVTKDPPATNRPMWFDFAPGEVSAIAADNAHRWKLSGTTLRLGVFALLLRWSVGGEKETVTTG